MNRVVLIGRLTKDPELRFTPGNGTAVTTFTLAIDRKFSKNNEADFIPIVVWGKQAESTANYMSKGKLIGIGGRIQTRSYDAKDGTKRYVTEVVAEEVQFLEWGNNKQSGPSDSFNNYGSDKSADFNENMYDDDITPVDEDEIPF